MKIKYFYGITALIAGLLLSTYCFAQPQPNDTLTGGGTSGTGAVGGGYYTNNINIPGGWSGISNFVNPFDSSVVNLFAPVVDDLVIIQGENGMYWPSQNVNTLRNWNSFKGYKIKMYNDVSVSFMGIYLGGSVLLLDEGWTIMPVLSECPVSIAELFSGVEDKLVVIKNISGLGVYWPEQQIFTIRNLWTGKAYLVKMSESAEVCFPQCNENLIVNQNFMIRNNTLWNDPVRTASTHLFVIRQPATILLEIGDYIGAFADENICYGIMEYTSNQENFILTVYYDDTTTPEKDGFYQNEVVNFRVFRPDTQEEIEVVAGFDLAMPNQGNFSDNGLSAIDEIEFIFQLVAGSYNSGIEIFPNPGNGKITIKNIKEYSQIVLLDISGRELFRSGIRSNFKSGILNLDFSQLNKGIYLIQLIGSESRHTEKLVIQ